VRTLLSIFVIAIAALAPACDDGEGDNEPMPTPVPVAQIVRSVDTTERGVALTFDVAGDAKYMPEILGTLREHGVRASFAVTGLWAESNADSLNAIAADGHEIINFTYTARSFTGKSTDTPPLTPDERALELARTERTVYRLANRETRPLARLPYGDTDDDALAVTAQAGYGYVVLWSIDATNVAADELAAHAAPGAIYRIDASGATQSAALEALIVGLRAQGYALVSAGELIAGA
jgi:peptidoglycan/xylan/chitin deacetylase (PgdA/CDA1 family)